MRIAIVGGGISGLAVAYELQRRGGPGCSLVLYEGTNRLGGIVETVRRDRFVVECGPDSWVTEKPWAREIAVELGLGDQIIASKDEQRRTLILQEGGLVPMPDGMRMMVPADLDAIASSPLFSEEARRGYASEPGRADELKAAAPDGDESVATFVRRHFGEEVAVKVAAPLLSGVFGGSIERLSVRSVMPAFVEMEREFGSLILALQHRTNASASGLVAAPGKSIFTTLSSGLGTMVTAMAATLPPAAIRLSDAVGSIARVGARWRVEAASGAELFDAVVLATPAHVTRQLLLPLDARLGELLDMDASSAIVVALAFASPEAQSMHIPRGFGFLAPQSPSSTLITGAAESPSLLACTFVDQKFPQRIPIGGVLLRAFYGGDAALALLAEDDASLITLASKQLSAVLTPLPQPAFTLVRRWPRSLPQYEVGHAARVAEIESIVAQHDGLHLAGNSYHGVGLPDLIRAGRALGRKLMA